MKKSNVNIVYSLILASQSPRRAELLTEAGYKFQVLPPKVSEIIEQNLNPEEIVTGLAQLKAAACLDQFKALKSKENLILAGDTLVFLNDAILGKPENNLRATHMLQRLSGTTHIVMTGLCLMESQSGRLWSGAARTEIDFRILTSSEIETYVNTGEPLDKAGAYGIQGEARKFVSSIRGSWSNVVGLPLELLESALKNNGWNVDRKPPQSGE